VTAQLPGQLRETVARDGDTIVYVARERLLEAMTWLKQTPGQDYDYLVDVTAVEFRDRERPSRSSTSSAPSRAARICA